MHLNRVSAHLQNRPQNEIGHLVRNTSLLHLLCRHLLHGRLPLQARGVGLEPSSPRKVYELYCVSVGYGYPQHRLRRLHLILATAANYDDYAFG